MNCSIVHMVLMMLMILHSVSCQDKPKEYKVGEPQFQLQAAGAGNNPSNFGAGFNAGVGTKVWESKDKSLELGVNYGQNFARVHGQTYKSEPSFGVGGTFRWGRK